MSKKRSKSSSSSGVELEDLNPKRKLKQQPVIDDSVAEDIAEDFISKILTWYDANARQLPWRGSDPYGVWVSEIMCQQTKVDTVIPYYERWMKEFPNISTLAAASEDDVNKVWAGKPIIFVNTLIMLTISLQD